METSPKSYYEIIDGKRYDRKLLSRAKECATEHEDGRIDDSDIMILWASAQDGRGITEVERSTLRYIYSNFTLTQSAELYLLKLLAGFDITFY